MSFNYINISETMTLVLQLEQTKPIIETKLCEFTIQLLRFHKDILQQAMAQRPILL